MDKPVSSDSYPQAIGFSFMHQIREIGIKFTCNWSFTLITCISMYIL